MQEPVLEGGCRCGAVRYAATGQSMFKALCHCDSCRRSNAAPVVGWVMFQRPQVRFTAEPTVYEGTPGARRGFCSRCGTHLYYEGDALPGLIDLTIGSLDKPETVAPQLHIWDSKRLPWLHIDDGLPRFAELPPME